MHKWFCTSKCIIHNTHGPVTYYCSGREKGGGGGDFRGWHFFINGNNIWVNIIFCYKFEILLEHFYITNLVTIHRLWNYELFFMCFLVQCPGAALLLWSCSSITRIVRYCLFFFVINLFFVFYYKIYLKLIFIVKYIYTFIIHNYYDRTKN